jgi:REP element-mobilizing transposase RayT
VGIHLPPGGFGELKLIRFQFTNNISCQKILNIGVLRLRRLMCGKALLFRKSAIYLSGGYAAALTMFRISRDTPAYYLTSVAHNRLLVFQTDNIKSIVCKALDEARNSAQILIFAYVIMPDHMHLITDSARSIADVLRFTNGIIAKRVIDYLKENNFESSLTKLRRQEGERRHKHSLFEHHPNAFRITSEETFMQKVNYVHLNPVRAGLIEKAEDYRFSSARLWKGISLHVEPLVTDHKQIQWRTAA